MCKAASPSPHVTIPETAKLVVVPVVALDLENTYWEQLGNDDVNDILFTNTGFRVDVSSSHDTNILFELTTDRSVTKQAAAVPGMNSFCLPKTGATLF